MVVRSRYKKYTARERMHELCTILAAPYNVDRQRRPSWNPPLLPADTCIWDPLPYRRTPDCTVEHQGRRSLRLNGAERSTNHDGGTPRRVYMYRRKGETRRLLLLLFLYFFDCFSLEKDTKRSVLSNRRDGNRRMIIRSADGPCLHVGTPHLPPRVCCVFFHPQTTQGSHGRR